jgi:hypothetical protein
MLKTKLNIALSVRTRQNHYNLTEGSSTQQILVIENHIKMNTENSMKEMITYLTISG